MPNNLFRYLAAALVVTAAACGSSSDDEETAAPSPVSSVDEAADSIDVVTGDYTFALADEGPISAGWVPVRITNEGAEDHQVVVARLHDGVTVDDFVAAEADIESSAGADLVTYVGGVNAVAPGATGEGWAELTPGRYVLLCFIPTAEGTSHIHEGMIRELEVVDDGTPVAAPDAADLAGTFTLADYTIALPEGGVSGSGIYGFRNEGTEPHEVIVLRMKPGKTLADASAHAAAGMQGEPPFTFAGGAGVIAPGATGYARLDLPAGDYIALCAIPSPTHHKAHVDLGMVAPFRV